MFQTLVVLGVASASVSAAPEVSISRSTAVKNTQEIERMQAQSSMIAPRGPLSGEEKSATLRMIASQMGTMALQTRTVFQVGVLELSDRVGLDIDASIVRQRGESAPPVLTTSRVGMSIPAKSKGVYMFDCGVTDDRAYEFRIFENGVGTFSSGTATSVGDRLVFAHAFTGDINTYLLVNFSTASGSADFSFSSCEVTELAPLTFPTQPFPRLFD